ncbi:MAG: hypothetical protein JNK05_03065 [Myxococcales bacterium]|nr:hypothetical protein [Myxococcales bacterium]
MISVSPSGRWGGRVTSRPLPDARDELDAIDPVVRERLADIWWTQSATELRVATSFAVVHRSLRELGAEASLVALAERAIDDEHRHAALCLEMATRLYGHDVEPPPLLPTRQPHHREALDEDERRALYVIGQCALNETFANAYLSTAYGATKSPLARAAINELMRDEIDHSRLGWAFLATIPASKRARISDWLVPLTITNLREWHESATTHTYSYESHGIPSADAVREALGEVVRTVLIPGFAHVGLDVRALELWSRAGMPTR